MNLREIARRAGVSTATVSRAINRVPSVNPYLARRVWKVVDEFGYFPNTQARALVSGRSRIFGLVVSEITNPFFSEVAQAFENVAVQHNYEVLLTSTIHDPKRMELAVRRMIERRVDGVAIVTFGMEESLIDNFRLRRVPLVFVDVGSQIPGVSNIKIDYQNGIRQAVQHLAALRHVQIAFVAGPAHLKTAPARKDAFEAAMREIGLEVPPELLIQGNHSDESGMMAVRGSHSLPKRPTAMVCSNDMTAIGVLVQAYEWGIAVPQELSVVGFDDISLAQFTIPPLTTVEMSQKKLATLAFKALLDEAIQAGNSAATHEYVLTTYLLLRGSTALAPTSLSVG